MMKRTIFLFLRKVRTFFLKYRWIFGALLLVFCFRLFLIDTFRVSSPSMEGALLTGDVILVSKLHYGARLPQILKIPFVEDENPIFRMFGFEPYLSCTRVPYFRVIGLSEVMRGDILAFNLPAQNRITPELKTNFIKRCIGLPGDTIEIVNGNVLVNSKEIDQRDSNVQYSYKVVSKKVLNEHEMSIVGIQDISSQMFLKRRTFGDTLFNYLVLMSESSESKMEKLESIVNVEPLKEQPTFIDLDIYPHVPRFKWNRDNNGPLIIPKRGQEVIITDDNMDLYLPIIKRYEDIESISTVDGKCVIDDGPINRYTFKKDYYYALGDNRAISDDSRYWGVVPEDHIIGKGVLILYSKNGGVRWNRFFKWLS